MRFLDKNQSLSLDFRNGLPKEVDYIEIFRYDKIDQSFNSKIEGGIVKDLTLTYLQPIINKKEQKLDKYTVCDYYWLVIKEGNYYAGSFGEFQIETPIESTYDKVFLLRTRNSQLIELK